MVVGWQTLLRQLKEEQVLIPVGVLEIVKPEVSFIEVEHGGDGEDDHDDQHSEAEDHVGDLTSVCIGGVGHVVKLDAGCPDVHHVLVLPYLIVEVHVAFAHADDEQLEPLTLCPFLLDIGNHQTGFNDFADARQHDEPDEVEQEDDDAGVYHPSEVDVLVE